MALVDDDKMYGGIEYPRETVEFFLRSYIFYKKLLESEVDVIESDDTLKELIGSESGRMSAIETEISRVDRFYDFQTRKLQEHGGFFVGVGRVSHSSIRFIKSVGMLYLSHLKYKRNQFSKRQNLSVAMLHDIDRNLSSIEETFNTGVMADADLEPLIADQAIVGELAAEPNTSTINSENFADVSRPRPVVIGSIEIFDSQLRRRCLDLLVMFQENGEPERLDQVITEATRIHEDRLRSVLGDNAGTESNKLIEKAFGNNGTFFKSAIKAERVGLHALFRGVFGYIRNPAHHRLNANLTTERVLQLVGLVDYLLSVLANEAHDAEA